MTFDQYIKNPSGSGSSAVTNKNMYHKMYSDAWGAIKLRENGRIAYTLYQSNEDYYIHFKIPAEVPKYYYDVVIRFFLDHSNSTSRMEANLANYSVQFYSNDPSFVFTFAYAFNSHKLFIKDLESKMSKLALTKKATTRNPSNQVGYVKTIYYAYLEMKANGLFSKQKWKQEAKPYSKSVWNNTVTHADDAIHARKMKGENERKKNIQDQSRRKTTEEKETKNTGINTKFVKKMNTSSMKQTKKQSWVTGFLKKK